MIRVFKDYEDVPEALNRIGCKRKIKKAIENQSGKDYSGYHYKDSTVTDKLHIIYKSKCAYCESKSGPEFKLQVEHYRPKDGLTEDKNHKGYYWLGCEWSNLLLACPTCNDKGAKGTKFPILGTRIFHDTCFADMDDLSTFNRTRLKANIPPLIDEQPLLLNPELDTPEEHLTFDTNGHIFGTTTRGKMTRDICRLDRQSLYIARREVRDNILEDIKVIIQAVKTHKFQENSEVYRFFLKAAFNKLKGKCIVAQAYTLWNRYCFDNFEKCFVEKLDVTFQKGIRLAFAAYQRDEL